MHSAVNILWGRHYYYNKWRTLVCASLDDSMWQRVYCRLCVCEQACSSASCNRWSALLAPPQLMTVMHPPTCAVRPCYGTYKIDNMHAYVRVLVLGTACNEELRKRACIQLVLFSTLIERYHVHIYITLLLTFFIIDLRHMSFNSIPFFTKDNTNNTLQSISSL